MNISPNKVVSLSYELRIDGKDGEIIETVNASHPLVFLYGTGNLLPKFESHIANLTAGASFAFLLKCEDAYGPASEEALIEVPVTTFMIDGEIDNDLLREGNPVPMIDGNGNHVNGIVAEVKKDTVVMDFNHPLAGDDLFFSGIVVDVREATLEEIERGNAGNGNCSPHDCSSCGDGCCS
ncbi:MAG: FKBP-type peptidyl-prolyl cis-trans isomerase [Bacteroidales bacterium]|jgi:FKBP-type peptidyl-prolyl cis-trans isomerase SlyD|nr:FKBP-type peptidyl-prolyl cis-trans isomerase [Bacteroidales bacterium]